MNVFFFVVSFFVDGLVGGSILALIRFCSLATYVFLFSLLVFLGEDYCTLLLDLIERLARPIFSVIDEAILKSISHSGMKLSTVYPSSVFFSS